MISLVVQMPEDTAVEVGTVGAEGAIGMAVGLGSRSSFICALVQVSGTCLRIPASQFQAVVNLSPELRELIIRYAELQFGQIQQTAACNALHQCPSAYPVGFCKRVTGPRVATSRLLMNF